ncbi:hypothetical protein [Stenotrophomonas sp. NLF4-10]|uniref:hypothetical protein n=1 Tax=Stenotrophomonas sp. NLF4-10 TaxID=2918754 RepID=UPI001EFB991F|nr:hypothetical protein [Stenotrophomonas sp. NLF4-10]
MNARAPRAGAAARHALLAVLLLCGATALPALGQSTSEVTPSDEGAAYVPGTGDAWLDRQLADVNRYADRYPEAFVDELVRYGGARRGYPEALMRQHGWAAADVWFACFWGKAIGTSCREPVRARAQHPDEGWKAVVQTLPVAPDNLHWRAVRHALVASYDHWDRPIRLDPLLQRQLGDRARRDAAARRD